MRDALRVLPFPFNGNAKPASSDETRNLEVVRRAFDAFEAGSVEGLKKILASKVHYRAAPTGKFTGDYRGAAAVMEFFGQIARETEGSFRVTPVEMAASGSRVFVLYKVNGRRGAKALDSIDVGVFTVIGGVVTEAMFCPSNYPVHAAFWA
jgi:ketosteroid isomerase-like protein